MKRCFACLAVILLLCSVSTRTAAVSLGQTNGKVLLIYMQSRTEDAEQQSMEIIRQVLAAGYACDAVPQGAYTAGKMASYSRVVVVGQPDTEISTALLADLTSFHGKILWAGPGMRPLLSAKGLHPTAAASEAQSVRFLFEKQWKSIALDATASAETYAAFSGMTVRGTFGESGAVFAFSTASLWYFGLTAGLEQNVRLQMALQYFLAAYLGSQTVSPGAVFNLDYIYPVSDFDTVTKMGTDLKKKEIPFTFTVMPFYTNADTTEAKMYGKLLRYLVACGGTPILHIPVFQATSADASPAYQDLSSHLETALKNYASLGIYPAAVELPEGALFYTNCTDFLTQATEVFTSSGNGKDDYTISSGAAAPGLSATASTSFHSGAAIVRELSAPSSSSDADADSFYQALAFLSDDQYGTWQISCPSYMTYARFQTLVDKLWTYRTEIRNFQVGNHTVRVGKKMISQTDGAVTYNGKLIPYAPDTSSESTTSSASSASASSIRAEYLFILPALIFMVVLAVAVFINWRKNDNKFIKRG